MNKVTVSEFGLISPDQISSKFYQELEAFAKTDRGKDVLFFARNGKSLQAKNYVGTIETKSGFVLEIVPKTAQDNIENAKKVFVKLLHILHKLPIYKHIDSAKFDVEKLDIFEIFVSMFLEEAGMIIKKGIKSDYIQQENNLFYMRGKLLIGEQIKQNSIHKERFFVQYDEYSQNRAENRLIKSTLMWLANISRDFGNQRLIRQHLEHMGWVEMSSNIDRDFSLIKADRGMDHYKNALIWAKVFLKKESFSSFSGDTIAFAILYPMEKLFEAFVEWWLIRHNPDQEIVSQSGGYGFVNKLFAVRPDFLIKQDEKIVCVADAKWKLISSDDDFSQSDFYQLFAYKKIFEKRSGEEIALRLYYPKSDDRFEESKVFTYFDGGKIVAVPLYVEKELLIATDLS